VSLKHAQIKTGAFNLRHSKVLEKRSKLEAHYKFPLKDSFEEQLFARFFKLTWTGNVIDFLEDTEIGYFVL
jgi:hypothetical protein